MSAGNPSQGVVVEAVPCKEAGKTAFSLARDSQFHIARSASGRCLVRRLLSPAPAPSCTHSEDLLRTCDSSRCRQAAANGDGKPRAASCLFNGTLPPPLDLTLGDQLFVWDEQEGSVVSGGGGLCVTLGSPNFEGGSDYDVHASSGRGQRPPWQGNNGTLEHEVWRGPLSDSFGTPGAARGVFREVVILFNKGETAETISTTVGPCTGAAKCTARDVVAKKALPPLAPAEGAGAPPGSELLSAQVPPHGVRAFVVG